MSLSSPKYHPIKVELSADDGFSPVSVNHNGNGLSKAVMDFSWSYNIPKKETFQVVRSDGEKETFVGYDMNATFYHYSKLLVVRYMTPDSVKNYRQYNNPISWTSEE